MSYHFNGIVSIDTFSSLSPQGAIVSVSVDTASDLPTVATIQTDWNVTPIINSTAKVVDDGSTYVLNSQGTWVQQPGQVFQNTYTKSEVDTLLSAKQDTLTFDTVPTEDSTNPVESGGVWSPLSELVDNGAKNVLHFDKLGRSSTYGNTYTDNGVTFTLTADGTGITVSGTAGTSGAFVNLGLASSTPKQINSLCNGQYVLSGGTTAVEIWARANSTSNYKVVDSGDGTLLSGTTYTGAIFVTITVPEGTVITTPVTVYPMICTKVQWDISQTFEPYALTNPEITAELLTVNGISGYKMVPCSVANTLEYTGISFTVPADSITLIGAFDIYNSCAPQRLVLSNNADPEAAGFHFIYDTGTIPNTFLQLNLCTIYYNIANAERTLYIHAARYAASVTGNRCGYWTKNLVTPTLLT